MVNDSNPHGSPTGLTEDDIRDIMDDYMGQEDQNPTTAYPLVNMITGVGVDAWGDFVELVDDVGGSANMIISALVTSLSALGSNYEIEVATGEVSSETVIGRISGYTQILGVLNNIPIMRKVDANSRISGRIRNDLSASGTYKVGISKKPA